MKVNPIEIKMNVCKMMHKYHGLRDANTPILLPKIYAPRHYFDGSKPKNYDIALDEFYSIISFLDENCNVIVNDWEVKIWQAPSGRKFKLYIDGDSCLPYSIEIMP